MKAPVPAVQAVLAVLVIQARHLLQVLLLVPAGPQFPGNLCRLFHHDRLSHQEVQVALARLSGPKNSNYRFLIII